MSKTAAPGNRARFFIAGSSAKAGKAAQQVQCGSCRVVGQSGVLSPRWAWCLAIVLASALPVAGWCSINLAAAIKVPVLLIHGEADERAPIAQGFAMLDALDKAGNPAQWWAAAKEGHGFYNEDNNIALFKRVEAFLGANLGTESAR